MIQIHLHQQLNIHQESLVYQVYSQQQQRNRNSNNKSNYIIRIHNKRMSILELQILIIQTQN
ncbi:unnamed protein product [Paramecium pentaurelia]|uniref:Uncharacterized protein n=1 Tax=Paramecium pentaurelia TaxID=43138 RepID=A0A8S1W3F5_9CILI|nr:unnamed protein product [Paramecium pentaurelia]